MPEHLKGKGQFGQVRDLMPVITALWEAKVGLFEPRSSRPTWATEQCTVSTKKRKKKNSHTWWHSSKVLAGRALCLMPLILPLWEAEVSRSPEVRGQAFETSLANLMKPHLY